MDKSKKIHVVEFVSDLSIGGIEKIVVDIASNLDPEKYEVDIISIYGYDKEGISGEIPGHVGVHYLPVDADKNVSVKDYAKNLRHLAALFDELKPDIVHVHNSSMAFLFMAIGLKLSKARPKVVRTIHFNGNFFVEQSLKDRIRRFCDRLGDRLASPVYTEVSPFVKEVMEKVYPSRMHNVIFNGIDVDNIFNPDISQKSKSEMLGVPENTRILTYVSRVAPAKGHHQLLEVWADVCGNYPDAKLLIVGGGAIFDEVKEYARTLGIEDKVIFTGFTDKVRDYLSCSDGCVFPSESEGFGVVMLEKIAMGLPVLASDIPVFRMITGMTESGMTYSLGDSRDLESKIRFLLDNMKELKETAKADRLLIKDKFSVQSMVTSYSDLYKKMMMSE